MCMPLEGFNQGCQERDQPAGTDMVGCHPCQVQQALNFWSAVRWAWSLDARLQFPWMIEDLHGICAGIACDGDERIEQEGLPTTRRFSILACHLLDQRVPRWITHV